ncbi:tRNA (adenosine(37)-N6)-dimethylallyltransferase MiaA [Erythrobacter sp. 3-20A1M]|uniref:tRNA (adenosine(37)-N6)-dimethylallyltransferase MiaA n=1 Tax=Erythrobacter sp. 3-20A1M TaxID=2653850 RepID=UPI001C337F1B|nr:tRNA (adenosine(37)-N6)-dimethylallyltransferase MiaA [Erythrobacter sp. 3-20A1M]QWC55722.1 tRNA (adenosine(37)-N6)-dimethylallyltransferase MiaA [Erythrobacter sp. 3-20A1M]
MSMVRSPMDVGGKPGSKPQVALIAGPTASGKSDCAVALALRWQAAGGRAVVINADSAQVYADLRVLSARPTEAEMRGIEHRLFGTWDGAQACSAAEWAIAAKREIAAAHADDTLPILVGGTGLYFKTLLEGIAPIPPIAPDIRDDVRALPVEEAYAALADADPERHAALSRNDRQRIARALEVVRSTGRPLAHWQSRKEGGIGDAVSLLPAVLLPEREWLYTRCDTRFERMIASGAIAEVEALLARRLDPDLPVMRAIGVPEIAGWLRGDWPREEAIKHGQQATRNYAKRQYTWFRRQPPQDWMRTETSSAALGRICATLCLR